MDLLERLKKWYKKQKEEAEQDRRLSMYTDSCKSFQIMEFNGKLYISHKGVPVVRLEDTVAADPAILTRIREDYLVWRNHFAE